MRTIVDYDETTGIITGSNGVSVSVFGLEGFETELPETKPLETEEAKAGDITPTTLIVFDLVKLGLATDDLVKLKINGLL